MPLRTPTQASPPYRSTTSEQTNVTGVDHWRETGAQSNGTTWKAPEAEGELVASGSIAPTMTAPSLVANFLSGQLSINWRYFAKIFQATVFIIAILFTLFLFYRDNELGRLQDTIGIHQFFMKALSIILYSLVPIFIVALVLWVSAFIAMRKKKQQQPKN